MKQSPPERQALAPGVVETMRVAAPVLHNGTYTVSEPGERGHFTVKVHTAQKGGLAGKRIISLLVGPDNQRSYQGVAFWVEDERAPDGEYWRRAIIWKKFRGHDSRLPLDGFHTQERPGWSIYERKIAVFLDLALRHLASDRGSYYHASGWKIQRSSRCVRCNRELTHPESIALGVGPECAGRVGK